MCLDIDRSTAQQQVERQEAGKETAAATPCHNHQDGGYAHVRRGEGGRGTLAHFLRVLHQAVEEALLELRPGQQFGVVVEVVADGGEDALRHVVHPYGGEVELGTGHRDEDIDEELFTYPGPNPTTKEEAILMMTDSVEAASRSLKEYNEESISNLVDRIIDGQVADGAFKECNITFKEIAIAKSVLKEKLKTIYHTRITYPELSPNKDNEEKTQTTEETNSN